MAYEVILDPAAKSAIAALPHRVRSTLGQVLAVLEETPWNGDSVNDKNPEGQVRQWLFGPEGVGMLTYLIVEHDREVHVLTVLWAG